MPDTDPHVPAPSAARSGEQARQRNRTRRSTGPTPASLEDQVRGGADAFDFAALVHGISAGDQSPTARPGPAGAWRGARRPEYVGRPSGGRRGLVRWLVLALALVLAGSAAIWIYRARTFPSSVPSDAALLARYSAIYAPSDRRTLANLMSRMPLSLKHEWAANGGDPSNTVFGRGGDTHLELVYASPGGVVRRLAQVWPTRAWGAPWRTLGTVPGVTRIRLGLLRDTRGLEVLVQDANGAAWAARELNPNTALCHWSEWASVR